MRPIPTSRVSGPRRRDIALDQAGPSRSVPDRYTAHPPEGGASGAVRSWAGAALLALLVAFASAAPVRAATAYQQSVQLAPGWNAVYLQVDPEVAEPAAAFAGVPVKSVWTWTGAGERIAFVQDAAEGLRDVRGWLGWFPPDSDEAYLTDLHRLRANRAYLIELGGSAEVAWSVTGAPAVRERRWVPNSFNLAGFTLSQTAPPSFAAFFGSAAAHAGQPVYRLGADGQWSRVADLQQKMRDGEAYWIYSAGRSDFEGPVVLDLGGANELNFDALTTQKPLRMRRAGGAAGELRVRPLPSSAPAALLFHELAVEADPANPGKTRAVERWKPLTGELRLAVGEGKDLLLRLGVQRTAFTAEEVGSVLEITDGSGARRLVQVRAKRSVAGTAARRGAAVHELAGLWVGSARLGKVSQAQTSNPPDLVPRPTPSEVQVRLIVHVDAAGQARLLKEVLVMWQDGDAAADPPTDGRVVLVTDEARVTDFRGAVLRDGQMVGRRFSSATLDYDALSPSYEEAGKALLLAGGVFGPGAQLGAEVLLDKNHPTNPFRHKFHPDHDNLDAFRVEERNEAFTVRRQIELDLASADPETPAGSQPRPEWGTTLLAGTYRETFPSQTDADGQLIVGLHRNTLVIEGTFELRRYPGSPVELNPEATP
jgi:hypothetical protein